MMMCVNCKCGGLTWANARQSCARMVSRGLPPDEAKARSPSCGKCATAIMRELACRRRCRRRRGGLESRRRAGCVDAVMQ